MTMTIPEYDFTCSSCGETITVNDSMKDALLEHGCVICGKEPAENDFDAT